MKIRTLQVWLYSLGFAISQPASRPVDDPDILKSASYALGELKLLSDSGVYNTISLSKIVEAKTEYGVFHHNTYLTLELASPEFASGEKVESFRLMVMRHFEDDTLSFAIDEFPEMNEDAIERYWIEKVERNRRLREEAFQALELEAQLDAIHYVNPRETFSVTVDQLIKLIATDEESQLHSTFDMYDERKKNDNEDDNNESRLARASVSLLLEISEDLTEADELRTSALAHLRARANSLPSED
mmetsp:Transcript_44589/g.100704  ORF Transcript_44589/g.100704 Transcript_44589/m.100704 type:complete len:244 (-) Transcript_44589:204-935(-)